MYRSQISNNLTWIRVAIIHVRPLLIKWAAVYIALVFFYTGWTINNVATKNNIQKSEQAAPRESSHISPEEKLKPSGNFEKPAAVAQTVDTTPKPATPPEAPAPPPPPRPNIAGNPYARGHCTWYAKSKRPDLPNDLGNANTWTSRAKARGIPTGVEPRVSAIAQKGMHVMYVEKVNPDGTMLVSEMNYVGLGKKSSRIVAVSGHQFIY